MSTWPFAIDAIDVMEPFVYLGFLDGHFRAFATVS
jgi:hypothetical protein